MAKDLITFSIAILTSLIAAAACHSYCDDLIFAGSTPVKNMPDLVISITKDQFGRGICRLQNQDNNVTFTPIDDIEFNRSFMYYPWSELAYDSNDHSILYTHNGSTVYQKSLVNTKSEREIVYSLEFEKLKNLDDVISKVDYDYMTRGAYIVTTKYKQTHNSTLRRVISNRRTIVISKSESFYHDIKIDSKLGYIFLVKWVDASSKRVKSIITRMDLEGKNAIDIVTVDCMIESITIDKNSGKLYWLIINPGYKNVIMRSNLDGSNAETLKAFNKVNILSIVVDKDYIYTVDYVDVIERFDKISGLVDPYFKVTHKGPYLYLISILSLETPKAISKQEVLSVSRIEYAYIEQNIHLSD